MGPMGNGGKIKTRREKKVNRGQREGERGGGGWVHTSSSSKNKAER
jgi:hypothetical protein